MISVLVSRVFILVFGTLYPAYASYKTVKTKNVRDYVKWMMYWIVFALFTCIEIFTDIFVAFWFPFYYEIKILFVIWLVCPATRGSTYIFRKVINPEISKHEKVIDSYIASLWDQGYDVIRKIGTQGMDFVVNFVFELLRMGHIKATQLLPQGNDVNETDSATQRSTSTGSQDILDETALGEEDFQILMAGNPDLYHDAVAAASSQMQLNVSEDYDSESGGDEVKSVQKRPLKVTKVKRAGLRERRKKTYN